MVTVSWLCCTVFQSSTVVIACTAAEKAVKPFVYFLCFYHLCFFMSRIVWQKIPSDSSIETVFFLARKLVLSTIIQTVYFCRRLALTIKRPFIFLFTTRPMFARSLKLLTKKLCRILRAAKIIPVYIVLLHVCGRICN